MNIRRINTIHEKIILLLIVSIAGAFRLWICFNSDNTLDGLTYLLNAQRWLAGDHGVIGPALPPLRIIMPAMWSLLFKDAFYFSRIINVIFGTLFVFPMYGIMKALGPRRKGVVWGALLLLSVYPTHVKWSVITASESPFVFFTILALYLFEKAKNARRYSRLFLFCGVVSFMVATMLHFDIFLLLPLVLFYIFKNFSMRVFFVSTILLLLFPVILMIGHYCNYHDPLYFLHLSDASTRAQFLDGRGNPWSEGGFALNLPQRILAWPYRLCMTLTPMIFVLGLIGAVLCVKNRKRNLFTYSLWFIFISFLVKTTNSTLLPLERYSIILGIFLIPHAVIALDALAGVFQRRTHRILITGCLVLLVPLYAHKAFVSRPLIESSIKELASWFVAQVPDKSAIFLQKPAGYQTQLSAYSFPKEYYYRSICGDPFKDRQENHEEAERYEEDIFLHQPPKYAVLKRMDTAYIFPFGKQVLVEKYGKVYKEVFVSRDKEFHVIKRINTNTFGIYPDTIYDNRDVEMVVSDDLSVSGARIANGDEWQERRNDIKDFLSKTLGIQTPPFITPLHARILSTESYEGYDIQKVVYESQPHVYVTANVYVPHDLTKPAPAILNLHGHWYDFHLRNNGKVVPFVQKRCVGLAKQGYIAMAIDDVGYGERWRMGHDAPRDAGYSPAMPFFLIGETMLGGQILDNMRAVDYLCSRKDVDAEKIGITGSSGGGTRALLTSIFDKRIAATVVVHSDHFLNNLTAEGCICEALPYFDKVASHEELFSLCAPRSFLLVSMSPLSDTSRAAIEAPYRFFDMSDKVKCVSTENMYGYYKPMREMMYAWFDQHLRGMPQREKIPEPEVEMHSPKKLACYYNKKFPEDAATLSSLVWKKSSAISVTEIPETKEECLVWQKNIRQKLIARLGLGPDREVVMPRVVPLEGDGPIHIECVDHSHLKERGFYGYYVSVPDDKKHPCVLYLAPKNEYITLRERVIKELLAEGYDVFILFVHEIETSKKDDRANALRYLGQGRSLFGARVRNVMDSIDHLVGRGDVDVSRITVWGDAETGLIALYAGALDERIAKVVTEYAPVSYRSKNEFQWPVSLAVFGVLHDADIPDVAALMAPRECVLLNGMNGSKECVSQENINKVFARTKMVYTHIAGNERQCILIQDPEQNIIDQVRFK